MKRFCELGIKPLSQPFLGDKIKITKILNREIIVLNFKIEETKYPKNNKDKCLHLQIEMDGNSHVVFTGSKILINTIEQAKIDDLPFTTTIIKNGECFMFS